MSIKPQLVSFFKQPVKAMHYFFPVETISRELDFRILLAAMIVESGDEIYVGQHDLIHSLAARCRGGIYVGKNIFKKRSSAEKGERYYALKDNDIDVVYLHEEGAVFAGSPTDWKETLRRQYDLSHFRESDKVCDWGQFQQQFDQARGCEADVLCTGHPRFDLYKNQYSSYYAPEVSKLSERFGAYVLINGNYGIANHGLGVEHVFSDAGNYNPDDETARLERVALFTESGKQLLSMVALTHSLSVKFPDVNFVYRPHPSENPVFYQSVFRGVKNIVVSREGPVGPWILGARALIHDGCTTAIEAALANIKVINYKPKLILGYDIWLPNQFGVNVSDEASVADLLNEDTLRIDSQACHSAETGPGVYPKPSHLLANLHLDSFGALLDVIRQTSRANSARVIQKRASNRTITLLAKLHQFRKSLATAKSHVTKSSAAYHRGKFDRFDFNYIEEKIKIAGEMTNKPLQFEKLGKDLVRISKLN
ncbi:MAG: hypothetical protein CMN26_10660 [Salinisphaera sp.]|nr:hypothetical protein [Salinisphaera sp.]|tara:strand:- start:15269 stop:16711 length:1443 start_codon:yes stop_codon:yes gene_type:complete